MRVQMRTADVYWSSRKSQVIPVVIASEMRTMMMARNHAWAERLLAREETMSRRPITEMRAISGSGSETRTKWRTNMAEAM